MGLNHLKLVLLTWETCGFCPQLLKNVSTAVHQDRGANSIQKMTVHVCGLASSLSAGSVIGAFVAPPAAWSSGGVPHATWENQRWAPGSPVARMGYSPRMVTAATPVDKPVISTGSSARTSEASSKYRSLDVKEASKSWQSLPDMWAFLERECGSLTAVIDPIHPALGNDTKDKCSRKNGAQLTYSEMRASIDTMAAALTRLGLLPEDCVSVFAENSYRWLVADQGIMRAGGCNAVRGATAPATELRYIYKNSNSVGAVVESTKLLRGLMKEDGQGLRSADEALPRFLVILFPEGQTGAELQATLDIPESIKVVTFSECLSSSKGVFEPPRINRSMKASLVYTSGTTGYPKGVVLSHANLLHQVTECAFDYSEEQPLNPWLGDTFVSILPCWHIFERTAEYYMLSRGVAMVYSNVRNFKSDLREYRPHFLVVVPRLLETIWKGVQNQLEAKSKGAQKAARLLTGASAVRMRASRILRGMVMRDSEPHAIERALSAATIGLTLPLGIAANTLVWNKVREGVGGRIKVMVCGGSSLPSFLEDFFEMAGLRVIVGYGLTETSPVISNRVAGDNLRGTVGKPASGTQVKIVDQETGLEVEIGEPGAVLARGPQVMRGYHDNPEATSKVIDSEGFFNTGDLGRFNPVSGDLIITGRAKDTIVLSNGENVEPQPLEDTIAGDCSLIDQVMLVGQDERFLGAIIALNPWALASAGLIPQKDASRYAALLGSTPLTTGPVGTPAELREAEKEVLAVPGLKNAVMEQLKGCFPAGRPWEQVGNVILKLEPFTTSNGLITQTLKIKRNVVAGRFKEEIDALYAAKR